MMKTGSWEGRDVYTLTKPELIQAITDLTALSKAVLAERAALRARLHAIRDICDDHYDGAPDAPHWMGVLMEIYDVLDGPAPKEEPCNQPGT